MITLAERMKYRAALKNMDGLTLKIEAALRNGEPLPAEVGKLLGDLANTSETANILAMIEDLKESTTKHYHEKLRQAAPKDLTAFAEFMNPEEPPARHHIWMCEKLMALDEGLILRLMISMPPGHAKSTYSSHYFPAWRIGKRPRKKFIQSGHTQNFCENQLGKVVRGLVDSDRYRLVFPEVALSADSKAAGFWTTTNNNSYLTRAVGQGISGFRAHCAGIDDPFASRKDAESQTIRDDVFNWYTSDFITRLLPRCPLYVVATRWHSDDLCGRIEQMSKEGKGIPFDIINLPAIAEDDDPMGRPNGAALWPELFDISYLMYLRDTLSPKEWNSLYQGTPVDEDGGTVKGAWFGRYEAIPEHPKDPEGNITGVGYRRTVLSVDTADKTQARNDYSVITVWRETKDKKHCLIDVKRKKVSLPDLTQLIENTARLWSADVILMEDRGAGTQYIEARGKTGLAPAPVIPISVTNIGKEFRFDGVAPMFQAGDVLLPLRANWLADYEKELLSFPDGKYDDQVDSTSQYLNWARVKRKRGTKKLVGAGSS